MRMPPARPSIAAVLLLGAVLVCPPALAQGPASRPSADLDSIRQRLATQPTESLFIGPVRADYRVRVEDSSDDLDYHFGWLYDQTTVTPGYVRPWYPIYHYQLQSLMIPLEHRAQLYPAGVPLGGNTVGAIRDAWRKRKERQAREQVEKDVRALRKTP